MAEEQHHHNLGEKSPECESTVISSTTFDEAAVETQDRGIFDLRGKKEEKKPEEVKHEEVPIEKYEKTEEKKGFLDKIKEKIPGQQKKVEDVPPPPPVAEYAAAETRAHDGEPKEKKGFLDKIKEKIPGQQKKAEDVSPPPPAAEPKEKNG